ncbi:MAG: hypothetical protein ACREC3_14570, partial [Methyloceanibacter sp.]
MSNPVLLPNRRVFLRILTLGVMTLMARGACAQALVPTPRQTEGPFYPDKLPFDTDNDVLVINDSLTPAVGEVTHLSGRILDVHGDPIRNALVEIWQVDNQGVYLHSGSANRKKRDMSFQGFGRFLTGQSGEYYFRTIKPVPYPSRPAPHIHFAIKMKSRGKWTTQCYVQGHPGNERDGILNAIEDPQARRAVIFRPDREVRCRRARGALRHRAGPHAGGLAAWEDLMTNVAEETIAVVGGGITGLFCAYVLAQQKG